MSGETTTTPGYQFAAGERHTRAKLNLLGMPAVRVNAGAVTTTELDGPTNAILAAVRGKNLLCNGDFTMWDYTVPLSGVIAGGNKHEYGSANRWVTANDANRVVSRIFPLPGELPDSPKYALRWQQNAAMAAGVGTPYLGQRLEDVRRLAGKTVTWTIYIKPSGTVIAVPITPQARQNFGAGGAADVVLAANTINLAPNVWTVVTATFAIGSIAGVTIGGDVNGSFTEVRIVVPANISFDLAFAHSQLEYGSLATGFAAAAPNEDRLVAQRYYQSFPIQLSANLATWVPFGRFTTALRLQPLLGSGLTLTPAAGAGAAVVADNMATAEAGAETWHQTVANSVVAAATLTADVEIKVVT